MSLTLKYTAEYTGAILLIITILVGLVTVYSEQQDSTSAETEQATLITIYSFIGKVAMIVFLATMVVVAVLLIIKLYRGRNIEW